jgi:hypothetical protein
VQRPSIEYASAEGRIADSFGEAVAETLLEGRSSLDLAPFALR